MLTKKSVCDIILVLYEKSEVGKVTYGDSTGIHIRRQSGIFSKTSRVGRPLLAF